MEFPDWVQVKEKHYIELAMAKRSLEHVELRFSVWHDVELMNKQLNPGYNKLPSVMNWSLEFCPTNSIKILSV